MQQVQRRFHTTQVRWLVTKRKKVIRRRNDRIDGIKEKLYMRDKEVGREKEKRVWKIVWPGSKIFLKQLKWRGGDVCFVGRCCCQYRVSIIRAVEGQWGVGVCQTSQYCQTPVPPVPPGSVKIILLHLSETGVCQTSHYCPVLSTLAPWKLQDLCSMFLIEPGVYQTSWYIRELS